MRYSKFKNKKIVVDEIEFDSKKEANRYRQLKLLENTGVIEGLELQKVYEYFGSEFDHF